MAKNLNRVIQFSSVQSLSRVQLFATPWTTARQAFLSISTSRSLPKCPLSRWCHPTNSSSVILFYYCPQSFPASGSFQISQHFTSDGQNIGVSASASVLPMNTQYSSPLGWTGWISLKSMDSQESSPTPQFKSIKLSFVLWSNSHIHTGLLEKPKLWLDGPSLTK